MRRVSLKTNDPKMAKAKAISYLNILGQEGTARLTELTHGRDESPSIGKVIEHYRLRSDCPSKEQNIKCLLRVIARAKAIAPFRPHPMIKSRSIPMTDAEIAKVMAVRSTELNDKLVRQYLTNCGTSAYTAGSTLASAKSVFADSNDWIDFKLPDIASFRAASKQAKQKYNPTSFQHVPKDKLDAMERDSRGMPEIRRAFICCRYMGMTPKEVSYARKTWIEDRPEGKTMCIRERPDEEFTLKTGGCRERDITLAPWMADHLLAADDYLIPLGTEFLRYNFMLRNFNTWLRQYIPNRKGAAYELRKQAGSDWLEATGSLVQVQYLLGHSSYVTTQRWYATWQRAVVMPAAFQEEPTI
jgi:integrase